MAPLSGPPISLLVNFHIRRKPAVDRYSDPIVLAALLSLDGRFRAISRLISAYNSQILSHMNIFNNEVTGSFLND